MDAREILKLENHLQHNIYPPVPSFAIKSIVTAIDAVNEGYLDEPIDIPGLNTMTAEIVVTTFHCEFFTPEYCDGEITDLEDDWN